MDNNLANDPAWPNEIDSEIFAQRILPALKLIRGHYELGLKAALDVFYDRYEKLRREKPDQFSVPKEIYFDGFGS